MQLLFHLPGVLCLIQFHLPLLHLYFLHQYTVLFFCLCHFSAIWVCERESHRFLYPTEWLLLHNKPIKFNHVVNYLNAKNIELWGTFSQIRQAALWNENKSMYSHTGECFHSQTIKLVPHFRAECLQFDL